jgi:hypothetical protein
MKSPRAVSHVRMALYCNMPPSSKLMWWVALLGAYLYLWLALKLLVLFRKWTNKSSVRIRRSVRTGMTTVMSLIISTLMMETETVSETLDYNVVLSRLITRDNFIAVFSLSLCSADYENRVELTHLQQGWVWNDCLRRRPETKLRNKMWNVAPPETWKRNRTSRDT